MDWLLVIGGIALTVWSAGAKLIPDAFTIDIKWLPLVLFGVFLVLIGASSIDEKTKPKKHDITGKQIN